MSEVGFVFNVLGQLVGFLRDLFSVILFLVLVLLIRDWKQVLNKIKELIVASRSREQ